MKTLDEQLNMPVKSPHEILISLLEELGIDERGGGPEGIYYTHPYVDGEYLYRNLHELFKQLPPMIDPWSDIPGDDN